MTNNSHASEDESFPDESIEEFFVHFDALLTKKSQDALLWVDSAPEAIRELDDWTLARADALLQVEGLASSITWLTSVVRDCEGFADAHHRLAELFEESGNREQAIYHHLETLRLDTAVDEVSGVFADSVLARIEEKAAETLARLPPRFRSRVGHVPVLLAARPSVELVQSGFDSRSLGLFSGATDGDEFGHEPASAPSEITLYTHCLWDAFGLDEEELLDEVRITVLHEVGHYFGLDETELAELGLD
jgi:predicted Zn-dependent protease with MMP-like domain